jgi:hypothetical protein
LFQAFILAFLVFSQFSCVTTKNLPQKPDWLLSRPASTTNYIGIGSAPVTSNINDYQQIAKKNALNDLAGEISMNISNASFLNELAVNDVFNETFDSRTQTTINENLEGYTLVGTFEDKTTCWAYYSLSKSTYLSLKQQRIQKALDNAMSKFSMAMQYKSDFKYYNALVLFVKATEDIKPYLAEPLLTNYKNTEIYFGNELFNEIFACFNDLKIVPVKSKMAVKRGQMISDESLIFVVSDRSGHVMEGIPVVADYSSGGLINNKARTDKDGKVSFTIPKIKSKKSTEYFEAKIDVATLLQDATNDFIIKKLLKNFRIETSRIETTILNPVFFVEITENKTGERLGQGFGEMCRETLIANTCDYTENRSDADYILTIAAEDRKLEEVSHNCKMNFKAEVTVQNQGGKLLYQRSVSDIVATQSNCESARTEAFSKGKEYIRTRVIPDILTQLF